MLRWVDVSRYQVERSDPLDLVKARDAGYSIVNVALTGGRGYTSGSWAKSYLDAAALLGMGRSCYHWLDGRTPGKVQALQQLDRMQQLFGRLAGFAHCVDIEETGKDGIPPPGWQTVVDYVGTVQEALGRPVVIYTGDWWWKPRGWPGSGLTPYLMAQPNAGKKSLPPTADDPEWTAGYGGWSELAIMQWGVAPLPGTGNCSLSAIRDPAVWATITGGAPMAWVEIPASKTLFAEFNTISPNRDKASDGRVGDLAHQSSVSDHNPDETGNTGGQSDSDDTNEVHAADVDDSGPWPAGWSMERFVQLILARCRSGAEKRLRYIIYERRIWRASNGWRQETYTGSNPHDKHAHFSFKYGSGEAPANPERITTPYGIVAAVKASQQPQEETVSQADVINALKSAEGRALLQDIIVKANANAVTDGQPPYSMGGATGDSARRTANITNKQLPDLLDAVQKARADIIAAVTAAAGGGGTAGITTEQLADAIVLAFQRAFGDALAGPMHADHPGRHTGDNEQG